MAFNAAAINGWSVGPSATRAMRKGSDIWHRAQVAHHPQTGKRVAVQLLAQSLRQHDTAHRGVALLGAVYGKQAHFWVV